MELLARSYARVVYSNNDDNDETTQNKRKFVEEEIGDVAALAADNENAMSNNNNQPFKSSSPVLVDTARNVDKNFVLGRNLSFNELNNTIPPQPSSPSPKQPQTNNNNNQQAPLPPQQQLVQEATFVPIKIATNVAKNQAIPLNQSKEQVIENIVNTFLEQDPIVVADYLQQQLSTSKKPHQQQMSAASKKKDEDLVNYLLSPENVNKQVNLLSKHMQMRERLSAISNANYDQHDIEEIKRQVFQDLKDKQKPISPILGGGGIFGGGSGAAGATNTPDSNAFSNIFQITKLKEFSSYNKLILTWINFTSPSVKQLSVDECATLSLVYETLKNVLIMSLNYLGRKSNDSDVEIFSLSITSTLHTIMGVKLSQYLDASREHSTNKKTLRLIVLISMTMPLVFNIFYKDEQQTEQQLASSNTNKLKNNIFNNDYIENLQNTYFEQMQQQQKPQKFYHQQPHAQQPPPRFNDESELLMGSLPQPHVIQPFKSKKARYDLNVY